MLRWIRFLLLVILFIISVSAGMLFTSQNSLPVAVTFFGYDFPVLSAGLWLTMSLLVGAIIGFLLSFLPAIFLRSSTASKDRKIERLEKEVARLRLSALKG